MGKMLPEKTMQGLLSVEECAWAWYSNQKFQDVLRREHPPIDPKVSIINCPEISMKFGTDVARLSLCTRALGSWWGSRYPDTS